MRNFLAGVLFAVLLLLVGALAYLRMGFAEVRADISPTRWEKALMFSAVHASVRRHAPELPNPVPPTDQNLIAGGRIYLNECSGCHGTPGKPGMPQELNPPIPQFPEDGTSYSEAQIFWIAKHGIRLSGMFVNGLWDSDEKLWTVAAYIKRIKSLPPNVESQLATPESQK